MKWFTHWLMPAVFVLAGIALLAGWVRPGLLLDPTLRLTMGLVVILLGLQRFVTARQEKTVSRRRFGGVFHRPWEDGER